MKMFQWQRNLRTVSMVLLATAFCACASVPEESVELSTVVGQRIAALQASHEAFVADYFRLSRDRIESFLADRWVPHFMETFVADANLRSELENVHPFTDDQMSKLTGEVSRLGLGSGSEDRVIMAVESAFGDAERGQIVLEFAQAAMKQIELQRRELLAPLKLQEATALKQLRSAYSDLIAMQNGVTAHLSSIHNVTVQQDDILKRLGLLETRDEAIEEAVSINESVVNAIDTAEDAESILTTLKGLLTP